MMTMSQYCNIFSGRATQRAGTVLLFILLTLHITIHQYDSHVSTLQTGQRGRSTAGFYVTKSPEKNMKKTSPHIVAEKYYLKDKRYITAETTAWPARENSSKHNSITRETQTEQDVLIVQTNSGLKYVELKQRKVTVEISFQSYSAELRVKTREDNIVTINTVGIRVVNYTLGLGINVVDIGISLSDSAAAHKPSHYLVELYRQERIERISLNSKQTHQCYLEQDCDLILDDDRPCGLQPAPNSSMMMNSKGHWLLDCETCIDDETCVWSGARWMKYGELQTVQTDDNKQIRKCLQDKQLYFLGDSTNRGIMQSLMEGVNTTLHDAVKSHGYVSYSNLGESTNFSFMYYPAFWRKDSLTFSQSLLNLTNNVVYKSSREKTILIVGGVQWLTKSQLVEIKRFTDRHKIPSRNVVIKTHSSGFHVDVPGLPFLHSKESIQRLLLRNQELVQLATRCGFRIVDTLRMTLSRFKEFLQGKCACHFHKVTKYATIPKSPQAETRQRIRQGNLAVDRLYKLGLVEDVQVAYHISGDIHNTYTNLLLSEICDKE